MSWIWSWSHYAREISKRSFNYFYGYLVLTSTLIRHENVLQSGGIWIRRLCVLVWRKKLWKRCFLKTIRLWRSSNTVISLPELSSNPILKWSMITAFSSFSDVEWTEDIWCSLRVQTPFPNFFSVMWIGSELNLSFLQQQLRF